MEKEQLEPLKQVEYEFFDRIYHIHMLYNIALDYANEKKFQEGYQVLLKLQNDVENTLEFASKSNLKSKKVQNEV